MNVNELKKSNYLKKDDVGDGILVTIDSVQEENIAREGAPEEMRWILYLREMEKGLVLNSTNGQIIAKITGSDESEDWVGERIVLYHDPNVSFGGKLVGGIRVRAPRTAAGKPASIQRMAKRDSDRVRAEQERVSAEDETQVYRRQDLERAEDLETEPQPGDPDYAPEPPPGHKEQREEPW